MSDSINVLKAQESKYIEIWKWLTRTVERVETKFFILFTAIHDIMLIYSFTKINLIHIINENLWKIVTLYFR